jgi:hypothetical protein
VITIEILVSVTAVTAKPIGAEIPAVAAVAALIAEVPISAKITAAETAFAAKVATPKAAISAESAATESPPAMKATAAEAAP